MSMNVSRYRHNYKGFSKKIHKKNLKNMRRTTTFKGAYARALTSNSLLSFLSLLVKSFEEEIQPSRDHMDTARG